MSKKLFSCIYFNGEEKLHTRIFFEERELHITCPINSQQVDASWDEYSIHVTQKKSKVRLENTVNELWLELDSSPDLLTLLDSELGLKVSKSKTSHSGIKEFPKAFMVTALALGVCLLIMGAVHWQAKRFVKFVSADYEDSLGEDYFNSHLKGKVLVKHSPSVKYFNKLTQLLLKDINRKYRYNFRVYLMPTSTVNAYALPGGIIVFNTGLITKAKSPEEILGVLGHEIGHVVLRHGVKKYIESTAINFLSSFVLETGNMLAFGEGMIASAYSRDDEAAADDFALDLLAKNGISSAGMASFFAVKGEAKMLGDGVMQWMSTHPLHKNRYEKVKKHLSKEHDLVEINFDLDVLKVLLK